MAGHLALVATSERISELHPSVSPITEIQKVTLHTTSLHNIIVCKIFAAFLGRKMSQMNIEKQLKTFTWCPNLNYSTALWSIALNVCHRKLPTAVLSLHHSPAISTVTGMHLQSSTSSGKAITWRIWLSESIRLPLIQLEM